MDPNDLNLTDLDVLQEKLWQWEIANFGLPIDLPLQLALGVAEEAGELCHAVLKGHQKIRGMTKEETKVAVTDAVGDICIYAINLCSLMGINFEQALLTTAQQVLKRDWKLNPQDGKVPE